MKAADILETALENPPVDRGLDHVWMDGARGVAQRVLQWRCVCRGGTLSALAGEIPRLVALVNESKENLAIAEARIMKRDAAHFRNLISSSGERIAQLTPIVEAAGGRIETDERGKTRVLGGWLEADLPALRRAVGQAEFELREAAGRVDPYKERWPPIRDFEKKFAAELREVEKAQPALKAAQKAEADCLALLEADRQELSRLKARRVA